MKKIVVFNSDIPDHVLAQLRETFQVEVFSQAQTEKEKFREAIRDAHGLLGSSIMLGSDLLDGAQSIQIVSSVTVGYDNYDLQYLTNRKILLTNTPDVLTETTADTGFALLMATARRISELDLLVKKGAWKGKLSPDFFGTDVHHKTLGVIGFGRIGQAVARRGALGFGMKILYSSRNIKPEMDREFGAQYAPVDLLLAQSDFVCVTVQLTPDTSKLIGERELGLMQSHAILINISRGQVVDESALINALQNKVIRGAGLDVFEREPLPNTSPLLGLQNVVLTPHVGSATGETRAAMAHLAVKNLLIGLEGGRPPNAINGDWIK